MVLSGIMITPFVALWIFPGLCASILLSGAGPARNGNSHPGRSPYSHRNFRLRHGRSAGFGALYAGRIGRGGTLISSDVYGRFVRKELSPARLLMAGRIATVFAGALMIAITYLVPYLGGAVDAYLTVASIMDMPLFVIAVLYGLLSERATWQGAIAAYLTGSVVGAACRFGLGLGIGPVTLLSAGVAGAVCPLVSLLTQTESSLAHARKLRLAAFERTESEGAATPRWSPWHTTGLWLLGVGAAVFLAGLVLAGLSVPSSTAIVLTGMLVYFIGGGLGAASS